MDSDNTEPPPAKKPFIETAAEVATSQSSTTDSKVIVTGNTGSSILVNPRQRGNALLKCFTTVAWEFDETIVPDYVVGRTTCALFLSLAYHNLKPDYINERIRLLGKLYELRVLLILVDMRDPFHCLKNLTRISLLTDLTIMLAWSSEEAAKILQTYKSFEHKPPDMIMEKVDSDPHSKLVSALTSIRSVNKTDASTLLSNYGSLEQIIKASEQSLALCPGLGNQKAVRLRAALRTPFLKSEKKNQEVGIAKYFKGV